MDDLNITQRCAARAEFVRDASPGCHVLVTLDGMWNPMRQVALGDLHVDYLADLPLIFSTSAEAEQRAKAWNERLPEQYQTALSICAMPIWPWCEKFIAAMDPYELYEDANYIPPPYDYGPVDEDADGEEILPCLI